MAPMPDYLLSEARAQTGQEDCRLQFTLVDCPGHASLIRTIIGGAQIIDMMVLVIDVNKGIQTQTAECVVIGEITTDKLIIVLNKIDLIPAEIREQKIERMKARLTKIFSTSRFRTAPIVCVSAAVGGEKVASVGASSSSSAPGASGSKAGSKQQTGQSAAAAAAAARSAIRSEGISGLIDTLCKQIEHLPKRNVDAPFYFAVDHCFPIKGHGTVLTGTVLSGSVSVHSTIEIPNLHEQKKV
jgi:selenocysteine-specific elongation factor